jgi:hypothetical protein
MRVPISHDLPKEVVRERLRSRSHEIADFIPGGVAEVQTAWPSDDRMTLSVKAMNQGIEGQVIIEESQVIFEVDLPLALAFIEPIIAKTVRDEGQKLITAKPED